MAVSEDVNRDNYLYGENLNLAMQQRVLERSQAII